MPFLHPTDSGRPVSARRVAELLLDPAFERDGINIFGGEPFMQAEGPLALVRELRAMGCSHIVCYSGYTYEALQRRAAKEPAIAAILADIDVLIDGPTSKRFRRARDRGPARAINGSSTLPRPVVAWRSSSGTRWKNCRCRPIGPADSSIAVE